MIKVTELMINDWVKLNGSNYQVQVIKKKGVIKLYENTKYGEHEIELNTDWIEEFIEPIPLTPEILEKNGFKEDSETNGIYWRPDCRKFCIVKELDTWYFAFRVLGEIVDKSSGYICISECNYVHKLQHALKLCEIEKEIVL